MIRVPSVATYLAAWSYILLEGSISFRISAAQRILCHMYNQGLYHLWVDCEDEHQILAKGSRHSVSVICSEI